MGLVGLAAPACLLRADLSRAGSEFWPCMVAGTDRLRNRKTILAPIGERRAARAKFRGAIIDGTLDELQKGILMGRRKLSDTAAAAAESHLLLVPAPERADYRPRR
jgi:hypothetical protein